MQEYVLALQKLSLQQDLLSSKAAPVMAAQLRQQGRRSTSFYRYAVTVEITEGSKRPFRDIDNYTNRILDAITRSALLWCDDEQIDRLNVTRTRDKIRCDSEIDIRVSRVSGQHSGVPTFFRACCMEAGAGNQFTYAHPGYHLAIHLRDQQPYDIEEEEWDTRVERLCQLLDDCDVKGVGNWFREHFPKCMKLVPERRMEQFIEGVGRAYDDGRMEA